MENEGGEGNGGASIELRTIDAPTAPSSGELQIKVATAVAHGNTSTINVNTATMNENYGTGLHSIDAECCRCDCCECICCVDGRVTYRATLRIWQVIVGIGLFAGIKYIWWRYCMFILSIDLVQSYFVVIIVIICVCLKQLLIY